MNTQQFDRFILRPVLEALAPEIPYSEAARRLLLGTAAHESGGLEFIDQITGPGDVTLGPAYGLFQIERATHDDVWTNFLQYRGALSLKVREMRAAVPDPIVQCATNLFYATAMARVIYYRAKPPLPAADDAMGLALYHKRFYNSELGKADPAKTVREFERAIQLAS